MSQSINLENVINNVRLENLVRTQDGVIEYSNTMNRVVLRQNNLTLSLNVNMDEHKHVFEALVKKEDDDVVCLPLYINLNGFEKVKLLLVKKFDFDIDNFLNYIAFTYPYHLDKLSFEKCGSFKNKNINTTQDLVVALLKANPTWLVEKKHWDQGVTFVGVRKTSTQKFLTKCLLANISINPIVLSDSIVFIDSMDKMIEECDLFFGQFINRL